MKKILKLSAIALGLFAITFVALQTKNTNAATAPVTFHIDAGIISCSHTGFDLSGHAAQLASFTMGPTPALGVYSCTDLK
jgi:hypothetical protein